jgi:galactose oxidase
MKQREIGRFPGWAMMPALVLSVAALGCEGDPAEGDPGAAPAPGTSDVDQVQGAAFGSGGTDPGLFYRLKSVSTPAVCADVGGKSTADNAGVLQFNCSSGENQRWYFRALSASNYQLSAKHSAKCLRFENDAGGKPVVDQDPCGRVNSGTEFVVTKVGTTTPPRYQFKNVTTGKCLQSPNAASNTPLVQGTCATSTNFLWTVEADAPVAQSAANGTWSQVYAMPAVPISAALLPNKKVIAWASWKALRFGGSGSIDQTVTISLNPDDPTHPTSKTVTNTTHNMFCPGISLLADGRVLVNGGDDVRTDATSIYNSATDSWTKGAAMHEQRWYNSTVTLPDGRALTLGGNRTSGQPGNGEIYNPANNTWTQMNGITIASLMMGAEDRSRAMEHPRLFVAPDGRIFAPGPSPNMQFFTLSGTGSVKSAGKRGDDEFSQNDVTVMIGVGKFLKAGGNVSYDRENPQFTPSSHNSYVIDINSGNAVVTKVAPMKYPRAFANGAVLPNGQVFVAGGSDNAKGFSDDGATKAAEMFDPTTNTWRELPPMQKPRPYHSIVLLLADGRVLAGGGGLCSSSDNCDVNHPDIEIYSPPYAQAGVTRPTITSAPGTVTANGGTFSVGVGGTVDRFSLVRMSGVTHSVNTDQRFMILTASGSGATRTVQAPANKNVAPPGYYLLFALDGDVPSKGAVVKIN